MHPYGVCLYSRDWSPALRRTVQQSKERAAEVTVVSPCFQPAVARECQALGVRYLRPVAGDDEHAASNAAIDHSQATWLLWLEPGDVLSDQDWTTVREIAAADASQLPFLFAMEVHTPGRRPHAQVDAVVRDEIRLHQRRGEIRFTHSPVPRIRPVVPGMTCGWLDAAIQQPAGGANGWQAIAARMSENAVDMSAEDATAEEQCDAGMIAFHRDRPEQAQALLMASLSTHPRHLFARQAYVTLLALYLRGRNWEAIGTLVACAKDAFPNDSEILFREGVFYQLQGHWQRALGSFRESARCGTRVRDFSLFQQRIPAYDAPHNRAVVLAQLGRAEEAEQQWREVTDVAPNHAPSWAALADLFTRQGRLGDAAALAQTMQQYPPLLGTSLALQARVYHLSGDLAAARCCLEQAVRYAPHDLTPLREMVHFFAKQGPAEEVAPVLRELQRRDAGDPATAYNAGTLLLRLGQVEEAVSVLEEAIRRDPAHGPAHHNLAQAYQRLGWEDKAEAAAAHARRLRAGDANLASTGRFLSEV